MKYLRLLVFFVCLLFTQKVHAQTYALGTTSAPNNGSINTCSGTFYDSGGASADYLDNENYTLTFCTSTAGQKMRMNFSAFSMEAGYDYLEIYDGVIGSPLVGTYSSSSPGTVTATGSCLTVRFQSDYSIVSSGWAATLSCTASSGNMATCDEFSVLVVNYGNSTLTRYDNATGNYLNTAATSVQGLNRPNFMYQLPNSDLLIPNAGTGANSNTISKHNPYTGASLGTFATGLNFPEQIKLGTNGYLYLANQGASNLKVYDFAGTVISTLTNTNITAPNGIGFDTGGNMYISNKTTSGKINKYTTTGTGITYVSNLKTYTGNDAPAGIAMKGNDLYVIVQTNVSGVLGARIEKFTNCTGTPTIFLTMNSGSFPYAGIVWGPDNRLYIADYNQNQVEIFNADGNPYKVITTSLNGPHGVSFAGCAVLNTTGLVGQPTPCTTNTGSIDMTPTGGIKLNINNPSGQPYNILWSNGASTEDISGLASGDYYVTVTDWNGVRMIDTFTVYAAACINGNSYTCNANTTALTATGGGTYAWSSGETTATIYKNVGTYTVTVTNGSNMSTVSITVTNTTVNASISSSISMLTCNTPSANLTASGGGTYLWNTGATAATISIATAGTYTVTVTNNACTSTASIVISSNTSPPVPSIAGGTSVCAGSPMLLTASGGNSYAWNTGGLTAFLNVSPMITTTYTVTATATNGCTASTTFTITAYTMPNAASITAASTATTCWNGNALNNGKITLSGFATGERYQYAAGSTFVSGSATPPSLTTIPANGIIATTIANPATTQIYTIRIYHATSIYCYIDKQVTFTYINCTCPSLNCGNVLYNKN